MNPDSLLTMPDAGAIIEPLAAISPLLGVLAAVAIAIVVFLYREKAKLEAQIEKRDETLVELTDKYNQAQMASLETLKDVAHVVGRSTETIDRAETDERARHQEMSGKLDAIAVTVNTLAASRP
jgi:hypothetical protein